MGNEDLGKHFESIGMLNEASEAYSRMRQDVSTTKHIVDCGIHLASVALQRQDWNMVLNNMNKISGVQNGDDEDSLQAYTKIMYGISLLGTGNFEDAAKSFLQTDFSVPPTQYNSIASPNDVAIYGGLLALATMDRKDLQSKVLDNQSFRTFLEHEPHIRKAISLFVNGRYSNCLSILESVKPDYSLDLHLQRHITHIYSRIRTKCIVQYFIPFSCVTLESLETAFAAPGQSIEAELVRMIREDSLLARIDTKNKVRGFANASQWTCFIQSTVLLFTHVYSIAINCSPPRSSFNYAGQCAQDSTQVRARRKGAATAHEYYFCWFRRRRIKEAGAGAYRGCQYG